MKKLFTILVIAFLFLACGPKRLGCGPNRCVVEEVETKKIN
jgi:hypothetical protein